ncbi:hypothetical protein U0C82_08180 [Fulvimarina sp. 2208YS6-2-32]|uniref:Uncharacterized protein n=1 Tax=Fulvimarina uroteuthidis TaxID=3098149 RepID=A0ABU5I1M4_9HYPH|nr:hypothetical protein [Fulvimarina sp. 2208YS6-2-32]MDY8109121.1 hypothetical protein [Fulvimarina sp. 2208YS6-2-32]
MPHYKTLHHSFAHLLFVFEGEEAQVFPPMFDRARQFCTDHGCAWELHDRCNFRVDGDVRCSVVFKMTLPTDAALQSAMDEFPRLGNVVFGNPITLDHVLMLKLSK